METITLNYFAILVCAIAAIVIGFLWYGPLFGKQWMALSGVDKATPEQMAEGKKKMPVMSLIQFAFALVMALVLSYIYAYAAAYKGVSGAMVGVESGFWAWLGFVAPTTVGMVLWEGRKWTYWFIVSGCWLVTLVTMGIIIGVWQ